MRVFRDGVLQFWLFDNVADILRLRPLLAEGWGSNRGRNTCRPSPTTWRRVALLSSRDMNALNFIVML